MRRSSLLKAEKYSNVLEKFETQNVHQGRTEIHQISYWKLRRLIRSLESKTYDPCSYILYPLRIMLRRQV